MPNSTPPLISVVVASFNAARTLGQTLESVLDQRYPALELIVIDGGSQDGSRALLERFAPHLAYWVSEPDEGGNFAINKGIARATGELVGVPGADDYYLPGALEAAARAAQAAPHGGVYYGNLRFEVPGRPPLPVRWKPNPREIDFYTLPLTLPATFFRRECLTRHGALNLNYDIATDYELSLRLFKAGVPFVHIDQELLVMRDGGRHVMQENTIHTEIRRAMREQGVGWRTRLRFEQGIPLKMLELAIRRGRLTRPLVDWLRRQLRRPPAWTKAPRP